MSSKKHILVTGANGFIGKNLIFRLKGLDNFTVSTFERDHDPALLKEMLALADIVIHLAGENRPSETTAFDRVNAQLTSLICDLIRQVSEEQSKNITMVLASSVQAEKDNFYGRSKLSAEQSVIKLATDTDNKCVIFRFPGVFGKWCKPNYNSVVATFCHNISRGLPIVVDDESTELTLAYIDDVIDCILRSVEGNQSGIKHCSVVPEYKIKLGELAQQIYQFLDCRDSLLIPGVGSGFLRALYSTFVSYFPVETFSYDVPHHSDSRGVFVEFLKTQNSGQFSYFSAHPGVTRGGHFHHTKTEKFLVLSGDALFRFRNLLTDEVVEFRTKGGDPRVVDTIPGWAHDITNVGETELIVMLWANENFDKENPDTYSYEV
jgi:UDP-2-acetamido-2,6-beta-L-arabino-hexul-4-ose reductase